MQGPSCASCSMGHFKVSKAVGLASVAGVVQRLGPQDLHATAAVVKPVRLNVSDNRQA